MELYHGTATKADEVRAARDFRDKMYADGFGYCSRCKKWLARDCFGYSRRTKYKITSECKECVRVINSKNHEAKRPAFFDEFRKRAEELYAANKRQCPQCNSEYDWPKPPIKTGKTRWKYAWRLCNTCKSINNASYHANRANKKTHRQLCKADPVRILYHRCKSRERHNRRRRFVGFSLTLAYLRKLWHHQGGKCAVTGLPFDVSFENPKNPFAPSLDRMDSNKGYEPDNVVFVLWGVNAALNAWGYDAFIEIARAATQQRECKFVV